LLRECHEALYERSMTAVFAALTTVLAKRRWGLPGRDGEEAMPPRAGCCYARQSGSVLRRGRVMEIIRPVSLVLYETLHDPPCYVRVQLRWHIHPVAAGSLLRLTLRYELNGAAALRRRHWARRLREHCNRMLVQVGTVLMQPTPAHGAHWELRRPRN
jgi:hypothetical protein